MASLFEDDDTVHRHLTLDFRSSNVQKIRPLRSLQQSTGICFCGPNDPEMGQTMMKMLFESFLDQFVQEQIQLNNFQAIRAAGIPQDEKIFVGIDDSVELVTFEATLLLEFELHQDFPITDDDIATIEQAFAVSFNNLACTLAQDMCHRRSATSRVSKYLW